jgi:multicomponent Na+:H+ antiporter subunit C
MNLIPHINYAAAAFLLLFGIYILITERNLIRKVIGMTLVQTCPILFFLTLSYKKGAALPILDKMPGHGAVSIDPNFYANPLPHALMLTAIVVGVSTLGVALTLVVSIYRSYLTLDEDEIVKKKLL